MTALLEARSISVRFGGITAVEDVSLAAASGELLGLIGPNGAGKTTLLRTITGAVRPQQGRVYFAGEDITSLRTQHRARRGIGLSHQIVKPFRAMTPLENVTLAAGSAHTRNPLRALLSFRRGAEQARAHSLLDLVGIADAANSEINTLPLGYLKRLEVARALALDPKVLLLDEPLAGLNQTEARRLADTILALNQGGATIILIEHNLSEVMRISSRLFVMDNGSAIAEGAPDEVIAQPAVRAAYMGEDEPNAAP